MKKHKIDQLFAEKLKNHKTPPADKVWETLEEELGESPRRRLGVWWKVAAAVLLCLSAGLWIYQYKVDDNKDLIAQQKNQEKNRTEQMTPSEQKTETLEENKEEAPSVPTSPDKDKAPRVVAQNGALPSTEKEQEKSNKQQDVKAIQPEPSENQASETLIAEQPVRTVEALEPIANIAVEPSEETALENNDLSDNMTTVVAEVHEPVKIIYKANTKTTDDEAVAEKDNKFFEVVKDIKNGDLGLADLREAKSDLFAAAFLKWKDKRDKQ